LSVLFRRKLRLTITVGGITHITTEAITTDIGTKGITTDTTITTTTIGTGPGLSASVAVRDIIAIGNRIIVPTALTIADVAK
jgi:ketopantoate hydroxymethyltransferase